jgi:hypothetical protein
MQLFVKVMPVNAGSSEQAGAFEMTACPPDVEADTVLSFLMQQYGEPIDTAYTSDEDSARVEIGWVFPGPPSAVSGEPTDLISLPFIKIDDGSLQPMFQCFAAHREMMEQLAKDGTFSEYTKVTNPQREYRAPTRTGEK